LSPDVFDSDNADAEMAKVPQLAADCLTRLTAEIMQNYSASYPGQLFKNVTKCKAIATAMSFEKVQ